MNGESNNIRSVLRLVGLVGTSGISSTGAFVLDEGGAARLVAASAAASVRSPAPGVIVSSDAFPSHLPVRPRGRLLGLEELELTLGRKMDPAKTGGGASYALYRNLFELVLAVLEANESDEEDLGGSGDDSRALGLLAGDVTGVRTCKNPVIYGIYQN